MSVRYKFKNDKKDSTLQIDGFHISVRDLKRGIVEAKKLGRVTDFDLIVQESNTEEIYDNDDDQIPKNSSVVVFRRPLEKNQKKVWYEEEKVLNNSGYSYFSFISSLYTTINHKFIHTITCTILQLKCMCVLIQTLQIPSQLTEIFRIKPQYLFLLGKSFDIL